MTHYELACKLTDFMDDLDPWNFCDAFGYGKEAVQNIAKQIKETPDGITEYMEEVASNPDEFYRDTDRERASELLEEIALLPFRYKLDWGWQGYAIATRDSRPLYVTGYRNGKYTFCSDLAYAKRYKYRTAKKHLEALEAELQEGV